MTCEQEMKANIGKLCSIRGMRIEFLPSGIAGLDMDPREFMIINVVEDKYLITLRGSWGFVWKVDKKMVCNIE